MFMLSCGVVVVICWIGFDVLCGCCVVVWLMCCRVVVLLRCCGVVALF